MVRCRSTLREIYFKSLSVQNSINFRFNIFRKLKDYVFQSVTQAYSEKENENPSAPNRSRTYDLPIRSISTSDALTLSYRRLVVARPLN